jgi:hypothetical protein
MSTRLRRMIALAFGCAMISILATAALAQAQQPTPLPKDFDTKGEFEGMAGNYMKCLLNGNLMFVRFDQKSKVKVTGTATADFLDKGLFVQFKGVFDRHGKGTEPIKEFVIFSPDANSSLGALESGGNAFDEPTPGKKKGPPPPTAMYDVAGRITASHNNLLSIDCGNKKLRAEVAPDATVKLDASDPSWASPGDLVKIKGSVDQPPHGVALAAEVSIQLSKPLAPRRKKVPGAKTADKASDKAADKTSKGPDKADKATDKTAKGDPADKTDKKAADPKAGDSKAPDKAAADKAPADKAAADKAAEAKKPDDKADPAK